MKLAEKCAKEGTDWQASQRALATLEPIGTIGAAAAATLNNWAEVTKSLKSPNNEARPPDTVSRHFINVTLRLQ